VQGREPMDVAMLAGIVTQCADREAIAWKLLQPV
jgi:hypothetical protein